MTCAALRPDTGNNDCNSNIDLRWIDMYKIRILLVLQVTVHKLRSVKYTYKIIFNIEWHPAFPAKLCPSHETQTTLVTCFLNI